MRKAQIVIAALLLISLLVACAPQASPAPAPAAPAKPAWQEAWDKVLAAAKAEGKLIAFTTGSAGEREAMMRGMKEAYGIAAEVTNMMPRELTPKISAERGAGLYLNDVYVGGYTSILNDWKPKKGWVEPFDDAFVLPDVTDPERIKKVWYQGKLPWVDKDHTVFVTALQPSFMVATNSKLVKPNEIKSYRDLLDPKWKGKLVLNDPTTPGGGHQIWQAIMMIMGEDFMRELIKTEPTVMRDQRLMLEWLSHGKVALVFAPDSDTLVDFQKAGAPISGVVPIEGGRLSAAASGIVRFNQAAHPNAVKVFINWLTSKEGQEIYAPAGMYHSLRLDVSAAHLSPERKRQEGEKYYQGWTEEAQLRDGERALNLAKELVEPLIKK